jgi:hypothetical protein
MKNVILYALIFSLLFNVFQYVNSTKILEAKDKEVIKVTKISTKTLTVSHEVLMTQRQHLDALNPRY